MIFAYFYFSSVLLEPQALALGKPHLHLDGRALDKVKAGALGKGLLLHRRANFAGLVAEVAVGVATVVAVVVVVDVIAVVVRVVAATALVRTAAARGVARLPVGLVVAGDAV